MKQEQNKRNNKTHQIQTKRITRQPVKLPYLRQSKPMRPYFLQEKAAELQPHPDFDLHTNHATMPRYEAIKDHNLVYFFSKATNKKIIDQLKQQQITVKQKGSHTQRLHQSRSLQNTKQVREVTKLDFDEYLNKMKARVLSESTKA